MCFLCTGSHAQRSWQHRPTAKKSARGTPKPYAYGEAVGRYRAKANIRPVRYARELLRQVRARQTVEFEHVKGHSGNI